MRRRVRCSRHPFLHARYFYLQAGSRASNVYGTTSFLHPPRLARNRQWAHHFWSGLLIEILSISNTSRLWTSRLYGSRCWTSQSLSIPCAPGWPWEIPWPCDGQPVRFSRPGRCDANLVTVSALRPERREVRWALQLHRVYKHWQPLRRVAAFRGAFHRCRHHPLITPSAMVDRTSGAANGPGTRCSRRREVVGRVESGGRGRSERRRRRSHRGWGHARSCGCVHLLCHAGGRSGADAGRWTWVSGGRGWSSLVGDAPGRWRPDAGFPGVQVYRAVAASGVPDPSRVAWGRGNGGIIRRRCMWCWWGNSWPKKLVAFSH